MLDFFSTGGMARDSVHSRVALVSRRRALLAPAAAALLMACAPFGRGQQSAPSPVQLPAGTLEFWPLGEGDAADKLMARFRTHAPQITINRVEGGDLTKVLAVAAAGTPPDIAGSLISWVGTLWARGVAEAASKVLKGASHRAAATEFLHFVGLPEQMARWALDQERLPPHEGAAARPEWQAYLKSKALLDNNLSIWDPLMWRINGAAGASHGAPAGLAPPLADGSARVPDLDREAARWRNAATVSLGIKRRARTSTAPSGSTSSPPRATRTRSRRFRR